MNPIKKPINWRPAFGLGASKLNQIKRLDFKIGERVLDLGCGMGFVIGNINAKEKYGLDAQKAFSTHAKRFFPEVEFSGQVAGQTDFNDNFFDTILALDVIEHVKGDIKLVREANRILKMKGYLVISTPVKGSNLIPFREEQTKELHKMFGHVRIYELEELKKILEENGFKVLKTKRHLYIFSRILFYIYLRYSAYTVFKNPQFWIINKWLSRLERIIFYIDKVERLLRIGRPFQQFILAQKVSQ